MFWLSMPALFVSGLFFFAIGYIYLESKKGPMSQQFPPLYSKTSAGKLQIWFVYTEGSNIIVTHGLVDGKKQSKTTVAKPKNVGRSNETTAEQQAILEAQSKWQHQLDRGYFKTKEEALGAVETAPMKAQNFKEQAHKIIFPVYLQPKLNGLRHTVDSSGKAQSKAGLETSNPKHWEHGFKLLQAFGFLRDGLDGEVYAGLESEGGLSLQEIVSAFRKENENTHKLRYFVYDIPGLGTFEERAQRLAELHDRITRWEAEGIFIPIQVVWTGFARTPEEANEIYHFLVEQGYEGMMYRNAKGLYEFGKRSYDLQKRKPVETVEAKVLSVRIDKNDCGVLKCELETGVTFDCLMRKDSHPTINYRLFENAQQLIGKYIEFEMECLSDAGVPTKPVGIGIREVNPETFEPLN
jgi:DNA ligase-1